VALQQVVPGVHRIGLGFVNAFLIGNGDTVLFDTGVPKRAGKIATALERAGTRLADVRHIAITHYHVDHVGSLAAVLAAAPDATVYVHPDDAEVVRTGRAAPQPTITGPEKLLAPLFRFFPDKADPAPVHREVKDGEEVANGLRVVHTPGHTPGHVCYLWPEHGGVLIVGDAAFNVMGRLTLPMSFEDLPTAKQSLRRIAELDFEVAVFGHGPPIKGRAAARFRTLVEQKAR
jgi:glyoxylase-like metal-dependent hydrolase (beta-lactamase superfamily II)